MELVLYGRYIIMIFSPLSSQFRINFCKNLQKLYCINSVLYSKCLPCTKNAISRLTSGPQKSFTTLFSPDRHRKKAQYSFYNKNLEKGNKITNIEGYRFFGTPCTYVSSNTTITDIMFIIVLTTIIFRCCSIFRSSLLYESHYVKGLQ